MKQWYEELFENYGMKYDNEIFVQGTIENVILLKKKSNTTKLHEFWI